MFDDKKDIFLNKGSVLMDRDKYKLWMPSRGYDWTKRHCKNNLN